MKLAPEIIDASPEEGMDSSKANIGLVGLELDKNERSKHWMAVPSDPEEDVNHDLKLHQVIVGNKASRDQEQCIEVEFYSAERKKITMPLAYLQRGKKNAQRLDMQFPAGTLFHLTEGDGPIFLLGSHVISTSPEDDIIDSEDIEEEEEEDDDEGGEGNEVIGRDIDFEKNPITGEIDEQGSKKRKQDGDRENGGEPKKLKSTPQHANSDMDDEGEESGGAGGMD
jgi:hypothetical protein